MMIFYIINFSTLTNPGYKKASCGSRGNTIYLNINQQEAKMITVYVWLPKHINSQKNVGHASMMVGGHTYISWWPDETAGLGRNYTPIRNKSFNSDVKDEGCSPDVSINLEGLDESAILQWWQGFGLVSNNVVLQGPMLPYNIAKKNCSTVVATGLKVGGGDKYSKWYNSWSAVWRPQTVLEYASSIKSGMASKSGVGAK
jgi:hypothetical protein